MVLVLALQQDLPWGLRIRGGRRGRWVQGVHWVPGGGFEQAAQSHRIQTSTPTYDIMTSSLRCYDTLRHVDTDVQEVRVFQGILCLLSRERCRSLPRGLPTDQYNVLLPTEPVQRPVTD